ncbi:MAG: hypothetical protein HP494_07935 [Nitrospira sp.]|nr:hypothetical protein [Nitrospira sp.]
MLSTDPNDDFVLQSDGLHQRPEIVKPVGAAVEDAQDKIDFGGSENGNGGRRGGK